MERRPHLLIEHESREFDALGDAVEGAQFLFGLPICILPGLKIALFERTVHGRQNFGNLIGPREFVGLECPRTGQHRQQQRPTEQGLAHAPLPFEGRSPRRRDEKSGIPNSDAFPPH
jgi:hypothetical protein